MLGGLALAGIVQRWFDAIGGSYLANSGVIALGPAAGHVRTRDAARRVERTLGSLLAPGASVDALRSTAFFDGAGAGAPLLVLSAWVAVALALTLVPARRPTA